MWIRGLGSCANKLYERGFESKHPSFLHTHPPTHTHSDIDRPTHPAFSVNYKHTFDLKN